MHVQVHAAHYPVCPSAVIRTCFVICSKSGCSPMYFISLTLENTPVLSNSKTMIHLDNNRMRRFSFQISNSNISLQLTLFNVWWISHHSTEVEGFQILEGAPKCCFPAAVFSKISFALKPAYPEARPPSICRMSQIDSFSVLTTYCLVCKSTQ